MLTKALKKNLSQRKRSMSHKSRAVAEERIAALSYKGAWELIWLDILHAPSKTRIRKCLVPKEQTSY